MRNTSQQLIVVQDPSIWHVPSLSRGYVYETLTRPLDIAISLIALVLASPIILITIIAIKLEDPDGPILYWSNRIGKGGDTFRFPKLRSMCRDAEQRKKALRARNERNGGPFFKMRNDPRFTRVGAIIRKWSIDELPQLLCVFRGQMSLIGPRPVLPNEFHELPSENQNLLCYMKPGISGLAQVNGRADNSADVEFAYHEEYARTRTVIGYLWILFVLTPRAVLTKRGAY